MTEARPRPPRARRPPPVAAPPDDVVRHVAELLGRTRSEVDRADTKASILLAGLLAAAAVGAKDVTTYVAGGGMLARIAGCTGAALVLVGVGLLGAVLYPRRHRPGPRRGVAYFGDVVRLPSVEALREALVDPTASAFDATVDQLWQSSAIVMRKYALLRAAIAVLAVAVAVLGLAVGLA